MMYRQAAKDQKNYNILCQNTPNNPPTQISQVAHAMALHRSQKFQTRRRFHGSTPLAWISYMNEVDFRFNASYISHDERP